MVHHLSGALILLQVHGDLSLLYGNHPVLFQLLDGAVQGLYGDTALLVKLLPGLFDDDVPCLLNFLPWPQPAGHSPAE